MPRRHRDTEVCCLKVFSVSLCLRGHKIMNITRIAAIGWILFIVGLSAAKSLGYGAWLWGGIETVLGNNRTMHFVMAGIMSILCLLAVPQRFQQGKVNAVILVLLVGCIIDECFQYFIPSRNFSVWDAVASCAGVLVFAIPVLCWRKMQGRQCH